MSLNRKFKSYVLKPQTSKNNVFLMQYLHRYIIRVKENLTIYYIANSKPRQHWSFLKFQNFVVMMTLHKFSVHLLRVNLRVKWSVRLSRHPLMGLCAEQIKTRSLLLLLTTLLLLLLLTILLLSMLLLLVLLLSMFLLLLTILLLSMLLLLMLLFSMLLLLLFLTMLLWVLVLLCCCFGCNCIWFLCFGCCYCFCYCCRCCCCWFMLLWMLL